jgi:AmmeMemoRadiSam system protein B
MSTRQPIVAGQFYPARARECRDQLAACLGSAPADAPLPDRLVGGIVPHAGWMCSGAVAGRVFAGLAERHAPQCVVLFGAVHRWPGDRPMINRSQDWVTPLGNVAVNAEFADALCHRCGAVEDAPAAFATEHSLEVQIPFIQQVFPHASIVPVMVPPSEHAIAVGRAAGRLITERDAGDLVIGTTDLTHYGPSYGFTPRGTGSDALRWAREINDRRLIDLVLDLAAEKIIPEAREYRNACGGGAVAATIAAARELGAERGYLLEHTTSREVLGRPSLDAVGYAGVVFGG